ncbi:MAG: succinylglutamate desuccinylase/aspartoacylase family protein [Thiotrichales bacterium]
MAKGKQAKLNCIEIAGTKIYPGQRARLSLPVAMLYTHTRVEMPIDVINGVEDGPNLFVCAAIHGDELNGIEIIRRLVRLPSLGRLRGSLVLVPIVNVYGVLNHSRYLPDRRDLNRSFPGSEKGSLASRLADLFMREIVGHCNYGIDIHTAAQHRNNLPHIRADLDDPETFALANTFGAPVLLNSNLRDGSLRQAAQERGIKTLLYEAGEALRFDEISIRAGVVGVVNVMRQLGMLRRQRRGDSASRPPAVVARSSTWVRAGQGGIFRAHAHLGDQIDGNTLLGVIADPFGEQEQEIRAGTSGIVIGRCTLPLINEGDALYHVARVSQNDNPGDALEAWSRVASLPDTDPELLPLQEPRIR